MDAKELTPLLGSLVKLTKQIAARQKAVETLLVEKDLVTKQEWTAALKAAQAPAGPNQNDIMNIAKVAAYLETLAKH
jgi:hypothetical protein